MSARLASYIAAAGIVAAFAAPTTVLAVSPVDQSGTSAPSEAKTTPPSPSNEATGGSSTHGMPGTTAPAETSGTSSGSAGTGGSSTQPSDARESGGTHGSGSMGSGSTGHSGASGGTQK